MAVVFDVQHYDADFDNVRCGRVNYNDVRRGIFIMQNVKRRERRTEVGYFVRATFRRGCCNQIVILVFFDIFQVECFRPARVFDFPR